MKRIRLIRGDRPSPPRPGHLSNLNLWQALQQAERDLQAERQLNVGLRQILTEMGDVSATAISLALFEAYPGRDVLELQEMGRKYLDRAESEVTIASLERMLEAG